MVKEIERKFIIDKLLLPDLSKVDAEDIEQHYLSISEIEEVRIRKRDDKYFITVKSNGTLERDEWEVEISQKIFNNLLPATKGRMIIKKRYSIKLSPECIAEIDIYDGKLKGLILVEVEFQSIRDATSFVPPKWFGRDVTEDARYKNRSLAMN